MYVLTFGLFLGLCAAAVLLAGVLRGHHRPRAVVGASVYAAGLLAMLGSSLLYRSAIDGRRRPLLRRLDHAAIFAMIAATATPFALVRAGGHGVLWAVVLWAVAAVGIAVQLSSLIVNVRRSIVVYLVLGWASAAALGPSVPRVTMMLIASGGICYSAGVVFLVWRRLPYHLAIWHLFVLAGAAFQYLAVLDSVVSA